MALTGIVGHILDVAAEDFSDGEYAGGRRRRRRPEVLPDVFHGVNPHAIRVIRVH